MNVFDLIVYLVLALAVWDGWRRGFILQLCSLAGVVAGIWLAARFGVKVGGWLRIEEPAAQACGFVVVLLVTILLIALAGRLLRKLFQFAGFGVPDILLGVVVAAAKYLLLLSVLFSAFGRINADHTLAKASTVEESHWYRPVTELSGHALPFLHWVGGQIPEEK